ncbi:MAG: hypothetical protein R2715_11565 [Ilumatobacteraceae bacterium]
MQFVASEALVAYNSDELLDLAAPADACTSIGREPYDDGYFTGQFETWSSCGGTDAAMVIVAAYPPDGSYGVLVVVQVVTDADLEALDQILRSFMVQ